MSWQPPDELSYSYLLGLYLGDGNISMPRQTPALRILSTPPIRALSTRHAQPSS